MKSWKKIAIGLFLGVISFFKTKVVWAQPTPTPPPPPTFCAFNGIFQNILRVSLGLAGVTLFVMVLLNGFKWLTAGTNEKAVQEARKGITLAIAGMALMIGAWFILRFIEIFTGVTVTEFNIPNC